MLARPDKVRLTPRELQILQLLADGYTTPGVAHKLDISVRTVEMHRAHLLEKFAKGTSAGAVAAAFRRGILT